MKLADLKRRLTEPGETTVKEPLYPRLLRLQHVHPSSWQRAVLGEGMIAAGALLAMADLASAWSMVVLPVAVGGVVKAHDVLAGSLGGRPSLAGAPVVAGAPAVALPLDEEDLPERNVRTFRGPRPTSRPDLEPDPTVSEAEVVAPAAVTEPETSEPELSEPELLEAGNEVARPGSAVLWAALQEARGRVDEGADLPFALLETNKGWTLATTPVIAAAVLSPEEQAGALREGLAAAAPLRAVLAYAGAQGPGLVGWERDLPEGVVTDGERVLGAVPTIY